MNFEEQKPVFIVTAVVFGITVLIVGIFLIVKRAPDTQVDDNFITVTPTTIDDDGNLPSRIETAEQFGEPGELNLWKMSGDFFTVNVLHEWEVAQYDAGGASAVNIYNPSEPENIVTVFLASASRFSTGERFPYDDWADEILRDYTDVEICDDQNIGGVDFQCFTGVRDDLKYWIYTGELNPELYLYISKTFEKEKATPLWGVFNSINFDSSDSDLADAYIIP